MDTLHEDQYTFFITSLSVLRLRRFRENRNTRFTFNNFFLKCAVYEVMLKNTVAR
jgi:hypothetical protein